MESRNRYPMPNIIFITILSLVCIFYFMYFQNFMPAKFYLDSGIIMNAINNPTSADPSYRNVAVIFKWLNITSSSDIYLHLLSWLIFQFFLLIILRINKNKSFSIIQIFFISSFTFVYGVYFNTFSKDLILIFFLLIFLNFYMHKNNFNYLILFIGFYTILFRRYWIILFIFAVFIHIIKNIRIRKMMFYIVLLFIVTIVMYDLFNNNFITNARSNVNMARINSPIAKSMINNLLPNINIVNDIINYFFVLITLIIPIQGIHSFNVIIYYLWIIILIIFIIKDKTKLNKKLLLLLFAYINMQALFEPDLGSVFRHQLALYPLIYYLLNITTSKENKL